MRKGLFKQAAAVGLAASLALPGAGFAQEAVSESVEEITESSLLEEQEEADGSSGLSLTITGSVAGDGTEEINELLADSQISLLAGETDGGAAVNVLVRYGGENLFKMLAQLDENDLKLAFPDASEEVYALGLEALASLQGSMQGSIRLKGQSLPEDFDLVEQGEKLVEVLAPYGVKVSFASVNALSIEEREIELSLLGTELEGEVLTYAPTGEQTAELLRSMAETAETDTQLYDLFAEWADVLDEMADENEGNTSENMEDIYDSGVTHEDADALRQFAEDLPEYMQQLAEVCDAVGDLPFITVEIGEADGQLVLLDAKVQLQALVERIEEAGTEEPAETEETSEETDEKRVSLAIAGAASDEEEDADLETEEEERVSLAIAGTSSEEEEADTEPEENEAAVLLDDAMDGIGEIGEILADADEEGAVSLELRFEALDNAYAMELSGADESILLQGQTENDSEIWAGRCQLSYDGDLVMQTVYSFSKQEKTLLCIPTGSASVYLQGAELHLTTEASEEAGDLHKLEFLYNAGTDAEGKASIYDMTMNVLAEKNPELELPQGDIVDVTQLDQEELGQRLEELGNRLAMQANAALEGDIE